MESTKRVEIGKAIGYGWDSIKKDFWYFIGIAFIVSVISGINGRWTGNNTSVGFLGLLLGAWMTAGRMKLVLSYYDKKKLEFSELFTQLRYFWRVLGATLLVTLIVVGGLILLIVPGIYWGLRYSFTVNLIVDRDLNILEAMGASAKLTEGVKWRLLGLGLVMIGVVILGAICLGVGVFIAIPITWLAHVYVYKNLLAHSAKKETKVVEEDHG